METSQPAFDKYVFVCTNERAEGERVSCGASFCGKELAAQLKDAVKKAGAAKHIRVSKSGCMDTCEEGANVLIYPDNLWIKQAELKDIPAILEKLGLKA
jgi:(2Fe-2S) ferredoxin